LPANLTIAAQPKVKYAVVHYTREGHDRLGIVAEELVEKVFSRPGMESHRVIGTVDGARLAGGDIEYKHPFIDRYGKVLAAEYVTTTDGTGLVHIAPGHGEEDYATGMANGLEVYCPVLANGRFDETAPTWLQGKTVWEGNPLVIDELTRRGLLLGKEIIRHSYPHDWRSKTPTIFRATEQWFIAIDQPFARVNHSDENARGDSSAAPKTQPDSPALSLRQRALQAAAGQIEFIPKWGQSRMVGMLESRPDWCISRQRAWGLPIPVFYNEKGQALLTPESVRAVARRFTELGSDAWFLETPAALLGADFVYPAGFSPENLRKEKDIFDVWFESGSSWRAVLQCRSYLEFPADLYLEGSDQHRGWFQLSLLPSLGATGQTPFKQVLTHGFAVKPDGTKVSKSDKEYVTATQEVNRHGADLLRLWVTSMDYQNDIPTSPAVIQEFGDKYRKIRNTLRYLLSNLYDFNPHTDAQPVVAASLDGWMNAELDLLIDATIEAYDKYQLHRVFRLLHDFCSVQVSSIYSNAMKDRLYCDLPGSTPRRRCQTVMYRMVSALTRLLAPILVFTADEAWEYIPHKTGEEAALPSVHMMLLPEATKSRASAEQVAEWQMLMTRRELALGQLDGLKKSVGLNKSVEAEVVYHVPDEAGSKTLLAYGADLEDLVGAGSYRVVISGATNIEMVDRRETYKACARCWKRRPDVGQDPEFPDLCARDAEAVRAAGKKN
jgi:isoleucyl-tRNA synthetase